MFAHVYIHIHIHAHAYMYIYTHIIKTCSAIMVGLFATIAPSWSRNEVPSANSSKKYGAADDARRASSQVWRHCCVYLYMCVHVYVYTHVCLCICIYVYIYVCVYITAKYDGTIVIVCIYTYMYICMYVHIHIYIYIYIYITAEYDGTVVWRGGRLGSSTKKMYGERLGDGVEYRLMSPTPCC